MRRRFLLAALAVALLLALAPLVLGVTLRRREDNPVLRGHRLATRAGCLACHQPPGDEIPNPGSRWGSVPRFGGGNAFMYVDDRQQIAEFIREGAKRSWRENPEVRLRLARQAIRMPAYQASLSGGEIADLTAWVAAMEGMDLPGGAAAQVGRELARRQGCTSCHGVEGAGGTPNPGALGGFVPGFAGSNFADLVTDEREFREWVESGTSRRVGRSAVARWFWRRQRLRMPAFRGRLSAAELGQLWAWVQAVREPQQPRPPQ
ncbi:MAG TPA: c-type cytochrome [Thermoanaerobaculia bacterium]|nr:c-type cytochrome [Thermoanaerobaculia bacterium]